MQVHAPAIVDALFWKSPMSDRDLYWKGFVPPGKEFAQLKAENDQLRVENQKLKDQITALEMRLQAVNLGELPKPGFY
jgi:hypothetical protein